MKERGDEDMSMLQVFGLALLLTVGGALIPFSVAALAVMAYVVWNAPRPEPVPYEDCEPY